MQLTTINTKYLGRKFKYYEKIDSTQSQLWRLINSGKVENGELIMANIQTFAKGTHGRRWYTDEEGNIAFSFYVETNCSISKLAEITTDIANIIVDIFKDLKDISIDIKAPNDLMINGKKAGGILTESKIFENIARFLVIGIGINLNNMHFSKEIEETATSIKKEFGIETNRIEFISEFCNRFEKILDKRKGRII